MIGEDGIIRVHRSLTGEVWAATGRQAPAIVAGDLLSFVSTAAWQAYPLVRVFGCPANVKLITGIWNAKRTQQQLQLATPQVCHDRQELQNPEIALWRSRQCLRSASLGGWHTVTDGDIVTYNMAAAEPGSATRAALLPQHPVWSALNFLQLWEQPAVADLLADVLDPRWFVDPEKPDRISRLQAFLGQYPGAAKTPDAARRRSLVRQAWFADGKPDIQSHGAFLWRRYIEHGELKAGRTFVAYLMRAWQAELVRQQSKVHVDSLFCPEMLMTIGEAAAYRRYALGLSPAQVC